MNENGQEKPIKQYSVTWSIEVLASSPENAALLALDNIMIGTTRIFEVTEDTSKHTVLVDLTNLKVDDEH